MKEPKNFTREKFSKIENLTYQLLMELGYTNISSSDLKDTPSRVAGFWDEFIGYEDDNIATTFQTVETDQIVLVKNIEFYSTCSHHLLPFFGTANVAYIAKDKVLGLSKISRIVQIHAHKLQMQERLASDIAKQIEEVVPNVLGVAVVIKALHMCQVMRGIKSSATMETSIVRGAFKNDNKAREELFMLLKG